MYLRKTVSRIVVSSLIFSFGFVAQAPGVADASVIVQKDDQQTANILPFVQDNNTCAPFTANNTSAIGGSEVLKTVSGVVDSAAGPVANAIVTSLLYTSSAFKLSCAVTGSDGSYSVQVLKSESDGSVGELVVSPAVTSQQTSLLTNQLGSRYFRISGTSNETKNITLTAANGHFTKSSRWTNSLPAETITAPAVQNYVEFDPTPLTVGSGYIPATAAVSRGTRISGTVTRIESLVRPIDLGDGLSGQKVLRLTISGGNPGYYLATNALTSLKFIQDPIQLSGIQDVTSTSFDESQLNGRWLGAAVHSDGSGGTDFQIDLRSNRVQTFDSRTVSGVTIRSDIWRGFYTLPQLVVHEGTTYDLTATDSDAATVSATDLRRVNRARTTDGSAVATFARESDVGPCYPSSGVGCTEFLISTTEYPTTKFGIRLNSLLLLTPTTSLSWNCSFYSSTTGLFSVRLVSDLTTREPATCGGLNVERYDISRNPQWDYGSRSVSTYSRTGNTATYTTSEPHNFAIGQSLSVNMPDPSFDALGKITAIPTINSFALLTASGSTTSTTSTGAFPAFAYPLIGVSVNSNGEAGINIPNGVTGIYRLKFVPVAGSAYGPTDFYIRATVLDGVLSSVEQCATFNTANGTCTSSWSVPPLQDGRYIFLVPPANFIGVLRNPASETVASAYVNVQKLSSPQTWIFQTSVTSDSSGILRGRLTAGSYKLTANPPSNTSYPITDVFVRVSGNDSDISVERCTTHNPSASSIDTALTGCTATSASIASPFLVQYSLADLTGFVYNSDGSIAGSANINVEKSSNACDNCWTWAGYAFASSLGKYSLAFPSAGTYRLNVSPQYGYTGSSTRTYINATVTVSGSTKTVTVNGDSDGQVNLTLDGSNFRARILKTLSPLTGSKNGNAFFERYDEDRGQYVYQSVWGNGDGNGVFAVNLTAGRWRIIANPGSEDIAQRSRTYFYAYVVTSGTPSLYLNTKESCAVASPISACSSTAVSPTDDQYSLLLKSVNVTGYALKTSSASRASNGSAVDSGDVVSWGWIEVQRYSTDFRRYEWTSDVSGSQTSGTGQFGLQLPEGKYRLALYPYPAYTAAGYSRKNFDFTVSSSGAVTCDVAYPFCGIGETPAEGRFDLHFGQANMSGIVTAGGSAVDSPDVRAERWNGSYFEWVNLWASTTPEGKYAFNIEATGAYRVTAGIPGHRTNNGYSPASIYIYRSSTAICTITEEEAKTASSCPSNSTDALTDVAIALAGANVRGQVKTASNVVVQYGHVNVFRFMPAFNGWEWVQGVPVSSTGDFNATLRSTIGETKSTAQRFRLEIMPPHGNTTLVRRNIELWVGDLLDNNPSVHTYIQCSQTLISNCNFGTNNANVKSQTDTLNVTLFGGNLTGSVQGPSNETVAYPWINMEKWTKPDWSLNNTWTWTQTGSGGTATGSYILDTSEECPSTETSCFFKVYANPGWVNPNNWTKHARIIEVNPSSGEWRTATQTGSATPVGVGSFVSSALNFTLIGSNITGTVKNGDNLIQGAWVALLKEQSTGSYSWMGGSHTSGSGQFGIASTGYGAGRYRLEIHPPWNSTTTRFLQDIVVAENGTFTTCATTATATASCTGSSADFTLVFPASNLQIRVCDKDDSGSTCTAIVNSHINILNTQSGQWIGGANTQTDGIARFRLDDGTYRADVNPTWNNPDGSRVEFNFTISGGVLTSPSSASSPVIAVDTSSTPRKVDVRLGSPNVSGSVKYDHDGAAGTATQKMAFAWVGVRNASTGVYLPGASTGQSGNFELALSAGDYVLTAYPNQGLAQKQPVDARITVASNGSVTLTSGGAWSGVIDFDAIDPNVTFTLVDVGITARQIFITKLGSGDTYENHLITSVAPTSGNAQHQLVLGAGTYKFRIQKSSGDFDSSGESCRESGEVVVTSSGPTTAGTTALNTWRQGFNATGDDLECKSP